MRKRFVTKPDKDVLDDFCQDVVKAPGDALVGRRGSYCVIFMRVAVGPLVSLDSEPPTPGDRPHQNSVSCE